MNSDDDVDDASDDVDESSDNVEEFSVSEMRSSAKDDQAKGSAKDDQAKGLHNEEKGDNSLQKEVESLRERVESQEKELYRLRALQVKVDAERKKVMPVLYDLLQSKAESERQNARKNVHKDSLRLGKICTKRVGQWVEDVWEDGHAFKNLKLELEQLLDTKKYLQSQSASKKIFEEDDSASSDTHAIQLDKILCEEEKLKNQIKIYETEKRMMIAELKRIKDEDESIILKNNPVLKDRYMLLNLLGKGGFSEVFKAFDVHECKDVACKIHVMDNNWSEDRKRCFAHHLMREQAIHKDAEHKNILRMFDSFATGEISISVLEYCPGKDLSCILRETPILPEVKAKLIITQVFRGLRYLHGLSPKVVHYDLKPANILFDDCGCAKLTDFGISKWVRNGLDSIELSSEGFGTYWYLPPECFVGKENALISTKVDVWSAGIVLYEMLYGRVPFGYGKTQIEIMNDGTILKARQVEFPESGPPVSQMAKDFIRKCLTYKMDERPDIEELVQDVYLGIKTRKTISSSSNFSSFYSSFKSDDL